MGSPYLGCREVIYRWSDATSCPSGEARRALGRVLTQIGVKERYIPDAQLALSEFVANAAQHACGPYEVRIAASGQRRVCEVADGDVKASQLPLSHQTVCSPPRDTGVAGEVTGELNLVEERGRGLQIVDCLTGGAWGFYASAATKVAWFVIPGNGDDFPSGYGPHGPEL